MKKTNSLKLKHSKDLILLQTLVETGFLHISVGRHLGTLWQRDASHPCVRACSTHVLQTRIGF